MAILTLKKILNHESKCWLYSAFFFLIIGSAANFAITLLWWLRIQPWYIHGEGTCTLTYITTILCWASSALVFLLTILIKPFSICGDDSYKKAVAFVAFLFIFSFTNMISAIIACRSALLDETAINIFTFEKVNVKCYFDLLNSLNKMLRWAIMNDKAEQFAKWYKNLVDKIGETEPYTEYLCEQVGVPTAISCAIIFVGIFCLGRVIDMIRKQPETVENLIGDTINSNNNYTISKY